MSSRCKSSLGFVDARVPVRATYVNLYKWPESDAEFVKSVTRRRGKVDGRSGGSNLEGGGRQWSAAPTAVDSYSCRQMYLRSYTFSRRESVPEKTQRCLGRVRETAAVFPFRQRKNEGTAGGVNGDANNKNIPNTRMKTEKKKRKKKACVTVRKLRDVSYSTLYFIFHRLLSCTARVEVVRRGCKLPQKSHSSPFPVS
ncbi:hypothetical protein B296_00024389 [Ensete ventricosum]|uniref:Uncharacterized protein n=1 Tax=Ensete ventricosum TaxID=4639 RepID=A0A427AUX8_ENSVE|nr:hypothetical protein B296_00024389 [Ensete ventricosum]